MIKELYYYLTAYIPRQLPTSVEEYEEMKDIFMRYYGLENNAQIWATVAGQICSTPANSLRKSYGSIVNAAKRLHINKIANEQKMLAIEELQNILKQKMEAMAEAEKKDEVRDYSVDNVLPGTSDLQDGVQALPELQS